MNTTQLECFVNLANTLNFMKTAEQMSLSQPAVSKQIQALEQELAAKLFIRTTRSVSLTDAGIRFLPEADSMLKSWYRSKDLIAQVQEGRLGRIRIGYCDPQANYIISRILQKMKESHLSFYPEFYLAQLDNCLSRLERGELDIILSMKDFSFSSDGMIFMKLITESFVCTARKDYPLFESIAPDQSQITADSFLKYPQIMCIPEYLRRNSFLKKQPLLPVNDSVPLYRVNYVNESYTLILAGLGYSLIPHYLLIPHPDLRFIDWKGSPEAPLGIYYRKGEVREKRLVREFLRSSSQVFSDIPSLMRF